MHCAKLCGQRCTSAQFWRRHRSKKVNYIYRRRRFKNGNYIFWLGHRSEKKCIMFFIHNSYYRPNPNFVDVLLMITFNSWQKLNIFMWIEKNQGQIEGFCFETYSFWKLSQCFYIVHGLFMVSNIVTCDYNSFKEVKVKTIFFFKILQSNLRTWNVKHVTA